MNKVPRDINGIIDSLQTTLRELRNRETNLTSQGTAGYQMNKVLGDINSIIDSLEANLPEMQRPGSSEGSPLPPPLGELHSRTPSQPPLSSAISAASPHSEELQSNSRDDRQIRTAFSVQPDISRLTARRIVAHDGKDPRSRPYDMLRTQLLQTMMPNSWKLVGVTSPTHKCGKTLTAINLAFSLSRQREIDAVLVDLDLRRPRIAEDLGIDLHNDGTLDVLRGRADLEWSVIAVKVGERALRVLATAPADDVSGLIGSDSVRGLFKALNNSSSSGVVVFNLPAMLTSDDALKILPELDCTILVTAVGSTKTSEVEECLRYLRGSHLVHVVINKATDKSAYYS